MSSRMQEPPPAVPAPPAAALELRRAALAVLETPDPGLKLAGLAALTPRLQGVEPLDRSGRLVPGGPIPGRPERPVLLSPKSVPSRSAATPAGRLALLHAVAHIEFTAINLALDAVWRFPGMPVAYYRDWLGVALDEGRHFRLVQERLAAHGGTYGDLPAHDGLWTMAERTTNDLLDRMALVPGALEARGLDASPALRDRLAAAGDADSAAVIDLILREEVGHVALGRQWFRVLCAERGLDPVTTWFDRLLAYRAPRLRLPLNRAARREAGFTDDELDRLERRALDPGAAA